MAKEERYSWNVQINGVVYLVEYMKGSVYINLGHLSVKESLWFRDAIISCRLQERN